MVLGLWLLWLAADAPEVKFGTPIAEADWAVTEDASKNLYDAVLLEEVVSFNKYEIQFYRKIRILSESGKAAAEYFAPDGEVDDLRGRVVDRAGGEVTFSKKEDFVKVLLYKTRGAKEKTRVLVPPGLTRDAVLEMSWHVDAREGLEIGKWQQFYLIQGPFYVKEKRFEVRSQALGSSDGYLVSQFTSTPLDKPAEYDFDSKGGRTTVTYRNVPPLFDHPFGNSLLDRNTAYVMVYKTFAGYPNEVDAFWKRVATDFVKDIYSEKYSGPREYKDWVNGLKANIPKHPSEALVYAFREFRKKIRTPDLLTRRELNKASSEKDRDNILRMAMEKGYADYYDIGGLFFQFLKDLDIKAQMIFANSFKGMLFFPNHMRPYSLPFSQPIFGVRTASNWTLVSPLYQEYPPGYVPASMQGTQAFVVNPDDKWAHTFIRLPRFGAKEHQRLTQYITDLTLEGEMSCTLKRQVSGEFVATEKSRYLATSEKERNEKLKNRWERRLPTMTISEVSLEGDDIDAASVTMKVAAKGPLDTGDGAWVVLHPFPGQYQPLDAPNYWPDNRSQPIILDHCLNQIDVNQITVPAGWKVIGNPSWRKANSVGEVAYSVTQKDQVITVRRDLRIENDILKAAQEIELKNYIAWMTEAMDQTLGISKGGE